MALAQQLLVRALIAWFAREPQEGACVRWGTALHDRFMLPHFVWEDFSGVLSDLERAGIPLRSRLVRGAARIPLSRSTARSSMTACGSSCATRSNRGMCSAEETVSGATSRPADSSVERLQVKAEGLNPARHVVACNGRRVPLASTGRSGEFVAGVRFKAWMLPTSLHPNTAGARAAHLRHHRHLEPALARRLRLSRAASGRHAARRLSGERRRGGSAPARALPGFRPHAGLIEVPAEERAAEFPTTLDLRRAPRRV